MLNESKLKVNESELKIESGNIQLKTMDTDIILNKLEANLNTRLKSQDMFEVLK